MATSPLSLQSSATSTLGSAFQQFFAAAAARMGEWRVRAERAAQPLLRHDPVAELNALADAYEERQPSYAADLRAAARAYEGQR